MKKTILIFSIALGASTAFAQTSLTSKLNQAAKTATATNNQATQVVTTTAGNYVSQASKIATTLNSALSLTNTQKPQVASIVTDYLKSKAGLSSLATSNASAYTSKLTSLNSGMLSKMKGVLTAVQYAKLLGLKTSPTVDAVSALFI